MPHANWVALNKIFLYIVTVVNHSLKYYLNVDVFWFNDFFFNPGFYLPKFTIHRNAREAEGYFFSFSTPLPYLDNSRMITGRELTSAISQQPDSNWKLLVSDCKSLTTLVIDTMITCPIYLYHIPFNSIN